MQNNSFPTTAELVSEKLHVQAENKFLMEYLTNKTKEYRSKTTLAERTDLIQYEPAVAGNEGYITIKGKTRDKFRHYKEKKKTQEETAAKPQEIQAQFLQARTLLERQLSEPDIRLLGKKNKGA
ncbi:coiled-coil domain-containing protein 121 [Molossus nigricans]